MPRIVLATFGSYGDVFPFLALGCGLRARGHEVCVAAPAMYETCTAQADLEFRAVRPKLPELGAETLR